MTLNFPPLLPPPTACAVAGALGLLLLSFAPSCAIIAVSTGAVSCPCCFRTLASGRMYQGGLGAYRSSISFLIACTLRTNPPTAALLLVGPVGPLGAPPPPPLPPLRDSISQSSISPVPVPPPPSRLSPVPPICHFERITSPSTSTSAPSSCCCFPVVAPPLEAVAPLTFWLCNPFSLPPSLPLPFR